MILEKN